MPQKYKVYFANRPVFFTQERPSFCDTEKGCEVLDSKGKMDTMLIENAVAKGMKKIIFLAPDVDKAWKAFRDQFQFVQAAGGVVVNDKKELLFIFRLGKWDLPKGKVEDSEDIVRGALREVEEECSLHSLRLLSPLCESWHTYIQNGEPMLKSTAWFVMHFYGSEVPKPQTEEGITIAKWLSENQLEEVKANTYPSVLDVIEAYQSWKKAQTTL